MASPTPTPGPSWPSTENCYAESLARRFGYGWGPGVSRRTFGDAHWQEPVRWNKAAQQEGKRHHVFCASMADVFDAEAPPGERERLWTLIRETPWLDWQLLTKRPNNIHRMLPADWGNGYRNVWLGVSAGFQNAANERIPPLLRVPATVHFLSLEPLIGPIDLQAAVAPVPLEHACIDWAIVGGESGPRHRPMDLGWARALRDRCVEAKIPLFFKQVGGRTHSAGGRILDGRTWDEFPERVEPAQPRRVHAAMGGTRHDDAT